MQWIRVVTRFNKTYDLYGFVNETAPIQTPTYIYNFTLPDCMTGIWGYNNSDIAQLGYFYGEGHSPSPDEPSGNVATTIIVCIALISAIGFGSYYCY